MRGVLKWLQENIPNVWTSEGTFFQPQCGDFWCGCQEFEANMETSLTNHKQFKDNSLKCLLNKYFTPDGLYCFYLSTHYTEIHCILKDYDLFEK